MSTRAQKDNLKTPGSKAQSPGRRLPRLLGENHRAIIMCVALVIFIWLLFEVEGNEIIRLDTLAYEFIVVRLRSDWLTPIMQAVTGLAYVPVLLVMLLTVEAFAPGRRPGLCAAVNLGLAALINVLLKQLVQRARPEGFRLVAESGYSFPSGHAMVAMAFYGLLMWMVWHYERDRFVRWLSVIGFGVVIVLVGISRIYLGVHYASDVVAGFCVGISWLGVYTKTLVPLFMGDETNVQAPGSPAPDDSAPGSPAPKNPSQGGQSRQMK